MPTWRTIATADEITSERRKLCEIDGRRLAVFQLGGKVCVIDNHCPHRGGPIGAGPFNGTEITCPWHGLTFDLATGQCASAAGPSLTRLPVRVMDGEIQVDVESGREVRGERVYRYLVRYGLPAHVGRFGSIQRIATKRGDLVLVATDRGLEAGELLVCDEDFLPDDTAAPAGEILRVLGVEEVAVLASRRQKAENLRQTLSPRLADYHVVDAELTFDAGTLILYHLGEPIGALGPLAAQLADAAGVPRVQWETLAGDASRKTASAAARAKKDDLLRENPDMRGPYERLKYDFRRVWECPVCRHRERTSGAVTSLFCDCQANEVPVKQSPMKLVDDGPRRTDGKTLPPRKPTLP
jgi:3-phenylpropionate/trans-cinnamate dioxygenase ferredoxin subunit